MLESNLGMLKMTAASLKKPEQEELLKYLQALLGVETVPEKTIKEQDEEERLIEMFYGELTRQLDKLCITECPPVYAMRKLKLYGDLVDLFREVERVLGRGIKKASRNERQSFYKICISVLIGRIVKLEIPLSVQSLIRTNKGKVAGVFDGAFPGYIRGGMLKMVLESRPQHAIGVYNRPAKLKPIQRQEK